MTALNRLRSMDAEELRFRVACEARKAAGRVRARFAPPRWHRSGLLKILRSPAESGSPLIGEAERSMRRRDARAAHLALATHFKERERRFPLDPRTLTALSSRIQVRFPHARDNAQQRADRVLAGQYDLLGYQGIPFGTPPRWHDDPVHGRQASFLYWAAVPYLDPAIGDHKVIWELNRHQHWLWLARAYHLTGDARYYTAMAEQLEDWLAANPPLQGINWASMLELGFRCLSWTWALHLFAGAARRDVDDTAWTVDLLVGIDRQLQHIQNNLSRYFSPNTHLLGEALALYVVSAALPELRESEQRIALGRRVLIDELDRQLKSDGGHAELSAHYHRYTTDFYLLALLSARTINDPAAAAFESAVRRLARYLRTIADDGGGLPLLGDDDGGQLFPICGRQPTDCRDTLATAAAVLDEPALLVSDVPEETYWLCGELPLEALSWRQTEWPSTALPDSGYYVSRSREGDHLIMDAGPHGFLNGGHAHADALSIVLTVNGEPLLVDSGTATYTMDARVRDRFRSTAMHNTVIVNGRSQSDPHGPFHWRNVADAHAPVWQTEPALDYVEGCHAGYAPVIHSRSVLAVHGFGWIVIDHLLGNETARADAFWHVHPNWSIGVDEAAVTLEHGSAAAVIASSVPLEVLTPETADGVDTYAPVYGVVERATCIVGRTHGALPQSMATFIARRTDVRVRPPSLTSVEVSEAPPAGWHGSAFILSWGDRQSLILACVENPVPGCSAPGTLWGTSRVRTDARFALVQLDNDRPPVLIRGSRLQREAGLVRA